MFFINSNLFLSMISKTDLLSITAIIGAGINIEKRINPGNI